MQSFSLDVLLEPVSPESPAGASLRYDSVYDRIQAARREEAALSQGVWERPLQHANWPVVEDLCRQALATRSKDLQLAVWLTEAWLRLFGLPGFASGLRLIVDLHNLYLTSMLPAPALDPNAEVPLPLDSDDPAIERRLNLLQWLNENLALRLRLLPLSNPHVGDAHPVSLADMETAQYRAKALRTAGSSAVPAVSPGSQQGAADGGLAQSLALTAPEMIAQMDRDLNGALSAVNDLGGMMDHYYGSANGGVLQLRDALEAMGRAIAHAVPVASVPAPAPAKGVTPDSVAPAEAIAITEVAATPDLSAQPALPVAQLDGRNQAYAMLGDIADYLTELEPHSPVPYLLRRAIAWGSMTLPELLPELLREQAVLNDVQHLLKIDKSSTSTR